MENENKARILFLYMLLNEMSDEEHPLSTIEIIKLLKEKYGVDVFLGMLSCYEFVLSNEQLLKD